MAFRDLVTGAAACGEASSSNPVAALANSLLGTLPKAQEQIREFPSLPTFDGQLLDAQNAPPVSLPGSEHEHQMSSELSSRFRYRHDHLQNVEDMVSEFQQHSIGSDFRHEAHPLQVPPQQIVSGCLRSFIDSSKLEVPYHAVQLLPVNLSESDKQRIRDRSSIMARHFMPDKGEEYVNAQVSALLHSLDIEDGGRMREAFGSQHSELERYWAESQTAQPFDGHHAEFERHWSEVQPSRMPLQNGWAGEFQQQHPGWVEEFGAENKAGNWAVQFSKEQEQVQARNGPYVLQGSQSLVETLSSNQDPKFQNSKFLGFVSKMSRGELIVEDNQVKDNVTSNWTSEFSKEQNWAAEFTAGEHAHRGGTWVDEFAQENLPTAEVWAQEFNGKTESWADEYQETRKLEGEWQDSYSKFLEEELGAEQSPSSKWVYQFSDQNPYVGHPNPLKEGQELFRRGLLSEAVLALEAEVLKNPENAEGWRLLGITHAENDDDRQAIASMVRARDADPTNLEVLLSLGVSHTNELEQTEALRYLRGWLQHHPKYGKLVSVERMNQLGHFEVTNLYNQAATLAPDDGDVHTVLGVLYNLSREYDKAIQAFETALKLKPKDYSLWNKLGATQANSARSADAIYAYQQALQLKPNYVRAWSNMGIGYANQARYEESIRYYVRALSMNPKAENAWQYLRMSLSSTRQEFLQACNEQNLDALLAEFPL